MHKIDEFPEKVDFIGVSNNSKIVVAYSGDRVYMYNDVSDTKPLTKWQRTAEFADKLVSSINNIKDIEVTDISLSGDGRTLVVAYIGVGIEDNKLTSFLKVYTKNDNIYHAWINHSLLPLSKDDNKDNLKIKSISIDDSGTKIAVVNGIYDIRVYTVDLENKVLLPPKIVYALPQEGIIPIDNTKTVVSISGDARRLAIGCSDGKINLDKKEGIITGYVKIFKYREEISYWSEETTIYDDYHACIDYGKGVALSKIGNTLSVTSNYVSKDGKTNTAVYFYVYTESRKKSYWKRKSILGLEGNKVDKIQLNNSGTVLLVKNDEGDNISAIKHNKSSNSYNRKMLLERFKETYEHKNTILDGLGKMLVSIVRDTKTSQFNLVVSDL